MPGRKRRRRPSSRAASPAFSARAIGCRSPSPTQSGVGRCPSACRAPARRHRSAARAAPAAGAGHRARRCPWAHRSCGRNATCRSIAIASTSSGTLPDRLRRVAMEEHAARAAERADLRRAAASRRSRYWRAITETMAVRSSIAAASASRSTMPFASHRQKVTRQPSRAIARALSSTHLCSVASGDDVVASRARGGSAPRP